MSSSRCSSGSLCLFGIAALWGCAPLAVDAFEPIDCNVVPRSDRCRFDVWPNAGSSANSDVWLSVNHDALIEIHPRVLVLNFDNDSSDETLRRSIDARIRALAEGSRYHGYLSAEAPEFVRYELYGIADYRDADPAASQFGSSTQVPVGPDGEFDPLQLFGPNFQFEYPAGSGQDVGLCALFEVGAINEVWLAVADGEREPPLMIERKQRYDGALAPILGDFNPRIRGSGYSLDIECGVTVRLAHLNPGRGSGCDLQVRGWSIVDTGLSIPYFAENATAFLNADFDERFGASFESFSQICEAGMPCVSYPTTRVAQANGVGTWRFEPYRQGCGTPEFPPNASTRYDWTSETPVDSRCEHYALGDGDGEDGDIYETYEVSKLASYEGLIPEDVRFPDDCGGGWQMYWRQSMPGLGNLATGADGEPMKNWWPFMFY